MFCSSIKGDMAERFSEETGPVHRLAFQERTKIARRSYMSQKLVRENVFDETLYLMCEKYSSKFSSQYRAFKGTVKQEDTMDHEWGVLPWREKLYVVFHEPFMTTAGTCFAAMSVIFALGSIITLLVETNSAFNPIVHPENATAFLVAEVIFTLFFTLETSVSLFVHRDRMAYARSPLFLVELLALLPFYVGFFLGIFVNVSGYTDTLRMFRIFAVVKYATSLQSVSVMILALQRSTSALMGPLMMLLFFAIVMANVLFMSSSGSLDATTGQFVMEDCECTSAPDAVNRTCPERISPFARGLPTSLWWSFATTLTVGYGDIVPRCSWGRIAGAICMITAAIIMAMPIAVLGQLFTDEVNAMKQSLSGDKTAIAGKMVTQHQKALQLACARRLHEIRPEKLAMLCRRAGLPAGSSAEMVGNLYALFGIDPSTAQLGGGAAVTTRNIEEVAKDDRDGVDELNELPVVTTLAESFFEYLRKRMPFEFVNLASPAPQLMMLIDCFFERVYGGLMGGRSANHLSHRLVCSNKRAIQRIIPLVAPSRYLLGIHDDDVKPPPDFVLPLPLQRDGVAMTNFAPRMATLEVNLRFGTLSYVLRSIGGFVPLVNGKEVTVASLEDRDIIDFGSDDYPMAYTFVRMDHYAHHANASENIENSLPNKLWVARNIPNGTPHALRPRQTISQADLQPNFVL